MKRALESYLKKSPVFSMLLGCVLISIGPFFVEASQIGSIANTFYRMLIGGICLCLITLIKKESFPKQAAASLCFCAALGLNLDLLTWNQSILSIGPGLATILGNLEIIFLMLFGWFFLKERPSTFFWKVLLLMGMGIVLLVYPLFQEITSKQLYGIIFGGLASLFYAVYLFFLKKLTDECSKYSPSSILSLVCLVASILLGAFMWFVDKNLFVIVSPKSALYIVLNSLFSQVIGWWLITFAIKKITLSFSGLILLVQPALTYVLDWVIFGRNALWGQILGCVILLIAIYFLTLKEKNLAKS